MTFICDIIYFTTVLIFGTAVSFCLAGISMQRKNILCLLLFCAVEGVLQSIIFYNFGMMTTKQAYPILTHVPLILLFVIVYNK